MGGIEDLEFGDYRVIAPIGHGGMGEVYEAEHARLGTRVAVKVIVQRRSSDPRAEQRFEREARALQCITHPNVVAIRDATFAPPRSFIVMELLRGETLAARLEREGRIPLEQAIALFLPMLSGVRAIHAASIIHRDLKLSNVMLVDRGRGNEPVVLDLGVSRFLSKEEDDSALTHTQGVLGTMRYLSPEQTLNVRAASPLSDQYALGLMLYECLTGTHPFTGASPYEIMHAIVNAPLPRASTRMFDLPPACDDVLARAMNRDPMQRYASLAQFGAALLPFAAADVRSRWTAEFGVGHSDDSRPADCTEPDSRSPARFSAATTANEPAASTRTRKLALLAGAVALFGTAAGLMLHTRSAPEASGEAHAMNPVEATRPPAVLTNAPNPAQDAAVVPRATAATPERSGLREAPPAERAEKIAAAGQPATLARAPRTPVAPPSAARLSAPPPSSTDPVPGKDDLIDPYE